MYKIGKVLILIALTVMMGVEALASNYVFKSSTSDALWQDNNRVTIKAYNNHEPYDVMITRYAEQQIEGFGGCFNELGWIALTHLSKNEREKVMNELFTPGYGLNFVYNRAPIGANDFATNWYSLNEVPGDFEMKHFSIKRDKKCLLKYIKEALKKNPDMKLWASPWSPPTWMKTNGHYSNRAGEANDLAKDKEVPTGNDQFILEDRYLKAYAEYFSLYVDAYAKEGVKVNMIQFQNEPYTFNIWPNTSWTPHGMSVFLGAYLGPLFAERHPEVELWLGTLNTDRLDHVDYIMNSNAGKYIKGAGFQWEGKDLIGRVFKKYPQLTLMQTENECGGGEANWGSAEHSFNLVKKYLEGGASIYTYFNMVLQDECVSSWGWKQNTLVIVDSKTKTAKYTPEFYMFKHVSHYVQPGAHKIKLMGNGDDMLAFRNPDGSTVLVVVNKEGHSVKKNVIFGDKVYELEVDAKSFNTLIINK